MCCPFECKRWFQDRKERNISNNYRLVHGAIQVKCWLACKGKQHDVTGKQETTYIFKIITLTYFQFLIYLCFNLVGEKARKAKKRQESYIIERWGQYDFLTNKIRNSIQIEVYLLPTNVFPFHILQATEFEISDSQELGFWRPFIIQKKKSKRCKESNSSLTQSLAIFIQMIFKARNLDD